MARASITTGKRPTPMRRRPIALDWKKSAPDKDLPETGLDPIGKIPWGSHICMFCETRQDLLDVVVAYFAPACHLNEYCLLVVSDPLNRAEAEQALLSSIPDLARRLDEGSFEIIAAEDWYYENGRFEWQKAVDGWRNRVARACDMGFDGVRACGNPFWRKVNVWHDIAEYEHALDAVLSGLQIIMLCTYTTEKSRPEDVLDIAQSHQCVIARRQGVWKFLEVPGNVQAQEEIRILNRAHHNLPGKLARKGLLTERERVVLAQIVDGASSKKAAHALGISPRTVEFHRANIMQKLGAKNTAELVRMVVADR